VGTEQFIVIALICAMGAFVQSISGFGYALLSIPLISTITSITQAIVIVTIASLFNTITVTWTNRSGIVWPVTVRVVLASIVGMPLGLWILDTTGDRPLKIATGSIVLVLAVLIWRGVRVSKPSNRADLIAGFFSGILTMSTGTTGPPIVIGLHGRSLTPTGFRGTIVSIFMVIGVLSLALFIQVGKVNRESVVAAAYVIPVQTLATLAGGRVAKRVSPERFEKIVIGLLMASAVSAIAAASR
jgi:uncharacterized protein